MKSIKIVGTGRALPERMLTNFDLEKMVDTSNEWIVSRTGIRERRIADEKTATSDLVAEALLKACKQAGVKPAELDAIIVATSTPDTVYPATACWVQKRLGISGMPSFDVSAGCSGFLFALEIATNLIVAGTAKKVVVVGGEVMSKVVDWKDRSTCVLFGDGAGAAVVVPGDGHCGVLASNWGCDGNLAPLLYQPAGGTRLPTSEETFKEMAHTVHMQGDKVFKHAVRMMAGAALRAIQEAKLDVSDISLLIPHQANTRIMEATRTRLGIPREKMFVVVDKYGNISAATIPIALDEAREQGRIKDGDIVVMTAFGTGFTWAASVLRW
ncbi:3-oxoacyl-ACP synthase [candidate division WOR-3 bacterium JGI_Cruoil_03_51_56]|uniref:Beta-ketoacyl-[acyl-carrier-protein] synthase III n=1 Tax=candidate division WOR-3 bacterium JGI_Cruoil_03_51_56 TaxID=1973747 RepID=A0A235BWG7_UNCW3|nr:MAG: 3-oxoacyl-ACP synthase [candidate division WOR-3 bacterium JGI_Cruoil_03_51_56]